MLAARFVEIVSLELPGAVRGLTLKLPFVSEGSPETLNVTELLPDIFVTLTVSALFDPRFTVSVEADSEMPKSEGAGFTVSETVVEWPLPLPLMVRV